MIAETWLTRTAPLAGATNLFGVTTVLTAKDIMSTDVTTITPGASIRDAVKALLETQASGLPVVDDNDHLLGIITEFGLLAAVYDESIESESVADHMTNSVITVDENAPLRNICDLFILHRVKRVPVVREGRLVGVLSRRDVLAATVNAAAAVS